VVVVEGLFGGWGLGSAGWFLGMLVVVEEVGNFLEELFVDVGKVRKLVGGRDFRVFVLADRASYLRRTPISMDLHHSY
jgi:hypothetical protein